MQEQRSPQTSDDFSNFQMPEQNKQNQKNRRRPQTIHQKIKSKSEKTKFLFPVKLFVYKIINGEHHFRTLLQIQYQERPECRLLFTSTVKYNNICIIRCRFCRCQIKYCEEQNGEWTLISYQNLHNHQITNKNLDQEYSENSLYVKKSSQKNKIRHSKKSIEVDYSQQSQSSIIQQNRVRFLFPITLLKYKIIQNKQQFKNLLEIQYSQFPEYGRFFTLNYVRSQKGVFPVARCRLCRAMIRYKLENDKTWSLVKFNNKHFHQEQQNKAIRKIPPKFIIKSIFLDHRTSMECRQQCNIILNDKNLDYKQPNFENLQNLLNQQRYDYRYIFNAKNLLKEGYPDTLVAISQLNKQYYIKFGQIIYFQTLSNFIKQSTFGDQNFEVGIIYGYDNNNKLLIFGICLNAEQCPQNYKQVFRWFFDMTNSSGNTSAIFTKQSQKYVKALTELKQIYNFVHIFEPCSYLNSITLRLSELEKNVKNYIIQILSYTIKQSDAIIGKKYLIKLKLILQMHHMNSLYQQIQSNIDHLCFWAIPEGYFMGILRNINPKFEDLIKKRGNKYCALNFIKKFQQLCKTRIKKSTESNAIQTYPFQKLFDDVRIYYVRKNIESKLFKVFIINYRKSLLYKILNKSQINQFQVIHSINQSKFLVLKNQCTCRFTSKTGIPCQHLIYVTRIKHNQQQTQIKHDYIKLFHGRWISKRFLEENNLIELEN